MSTIHKRKPFSLCFWSLAFLLGSSTAHAASVATAATYPQYSAVIDAGSSGTRLYLYRIDANHSINMLLSNVEFKEEDGIDNFLCDPALPQSDVMKVIITPLLTRVKDYVKQQTLTVSAKDIEVNLLATAGMRSRLNSCNEIGNMMTPPQPNWGATKSKSLYRTIKNGIKSNGFRPGEVRTSDGNREEGPWTWLNLNYVLGKLDTGPVGDLEVGGSSFQIVYPTNSPANDAQNIYPIKYNGKTYNVFARSYLGLGQDDARKWIRTSTAAPEACWAKGFSANSDIGEKDARFPKLTKDGDFDYATCKGYYQQYIKSIIDSQGSPQTARSTSNFVGLDGAWYAYDYFLTPPVTLFRSSPLLCRHSARAAPTSRKLRQIF